MFLHAVFFGVCVPLNVLSKGLEESQCTNVIYTPFDLSMVQTECPTMCVLLHTRETYHVCPKLSACLPSTNCDYFIKETNTV